MDESLVKQIFFYCKNNNPNGLYTDPRDESLDVLEFANKIEAVISDRIRLEEHARCVDIVKSVNRDVARLLEDRK